MRVSSVSDEALLAGFATGDRDAAAGFVRRFQSRVYGLAVTILGAPGGSAFGAFVPALSALFAIPLLGEWPGTVDWAGIALISAGVYLASGAPLPSRAQRETHPSAI